MRTSRKALAASFVVTFAAGCEAKSSQQPPTAPTVDVGAAPSSSAATVGASNSTPSDSAAPAASSSAQALPPAPSTGRVERQPDGSCMWYSDVHCPTRNGHIIACNPPPPHKVQCPSDGGT